MFGIDLDKLEQSDYALIGVIMVLLVILYYNSWCQDDSNDKQSARENFNDQYFEPLLKTTSVAMNAAKDAVRIAHESVQSYDAPHVIREKKTVANEALEEAHRESMKNIDIITRVLFDTAQEVAEQATREVQEQVDREVQEQATRYVQEQVARDGQAQSVQEARDVQAQSVQDQVVQEELESQLEKQYGKNRTDIPEGEEGCGWKYPQFKRGWYDITGDGKKNDYCRRVGNYSGPDGWMSCVKSGLPYADANTSKDETALYNLSGREFEKLDPSHKCYDSRYKN
jgi:hypothetical protein